MAGNHHTQCRIKQPVQPGVPKLTGGAYSMQRSQPKGREVGETWSVFGSPTEAQFSCTNEHISRGSRRKADFKPTTRSSENNI